MRTKALIRPDAQKLILQCFARSLRRDAAIVEAAQRAPDVDWDADEGPKRPSGMSARDFRIAEHAMRSSRNAPVYLTEAYRSYELARKIEAGQDTGLNPQIARAVVLVVAKPQYERVELGRNAIDVEAKEVS